MTGRLDEKHGVAYGTGGKLLDAYRPADVHAPVPTVLLWHGSGPDERDVLAPLARAAAGHGMAVLVPDWRSDAADGGWAHLTESVAFVREHAAAFGGDDERIVLAGWSLGALAAADIVLEPSRTGGWRPTAFVGIAGKYVPDKPEMGIRSPVEAVAAGASFPLPAHLLHGTADAVVPPQESRDFHAALVEQGCDASLTESGTDHAGVVMTEYSPAHGRCLKARGEPALRAGRAAAAAMAHAAGVPLLH